MSVDDLISAFIIVFLILLNAFFVAAEFAIVGAPRASIERRAVQGNRIARRVSRILHDPALLDRYIATAQIGITFASLGLGMYGEHVLARWIGQVTESLPLPHWLAVHALSSVLALAFLTYFHIVLGEMVPKSLALQLPEGTVLWISPLMLWVKRGLYPLVILLNGIGNLMLRLLRVERAVNTGFYLSTEELQYIVEESQAGGLLRNGAGEVLRDLLEFGELTAAEVMVPRVRMVGIRVDAPVEEVREIVRTSRHSRYPVYEADLDHILGMVHIKDLLRLMLHGRHLSRNDLRPVPYVPETSKLDAVLAAMRRRRTHLAVVMDEYGGTAGLITIENLFEEVVGDINVGVAELAEMYEDGEGRLHVLGTVRIDEVGEWLEIPLEHEEVYTVSGLVLMLLDRQPRVGDQVVYGNVRFEVASVRGHGVEECIVIPLEPLEKE